MPENHAPASLKDRQVQVPARELLLKLRRLGKRLKGGMEKAKRRVNTAAESGENWG